MSKNFSLIHDLGLISKIELQQYLRGASEYFGLDPDLNALDLIWMDGGDGKRRLIPYARRGTTDILRGIHGINVLSITKDSGPGYISFTAIGKNRDGRQEIAVGAASLEGLKGDRLAAAVATAQTRALRRLTLQFVGGGLLDESELNETTADINKASTSLASMATLPAPQPTMVPNTEAGKDVTMIGPSQDFKTQAQVAAVILVRDAHKIMEAPAPFSSGTIVPQPIPGTEPLVQIERHSPSITKIPDAPDTRHAHAEIPSAEPKRRRRRTKAEMEASRNDVTAAEDFGTPIVPAENLFVTPDLIKPSPELIQVKEDELKNAMQPLFDPQPPFNLDYPTVEQEADYRKRLQTWVDVLKTAGMTGGINWRLKRYTLAMFPDAVVDNGRLRLTSTQWDALLADFDTKQHQLGPQALVAEINAVAEKA